MNEKYRMLTKIVRNMKLKKNRSLENFNDNEAETLRFITKHNGTNASLISNYLNVDKALVSRIVNKLALEGYIEIKEGSDKRKKDLYATKKALTLKLNDELFEIEYYKNLFSEISEDEQALFFETLEKVYLKSKALRKSDTNEKIR